MFRPSPWPLVKHFAFYVGFCFIVLFILSVPFDYTYLPDLSFYTAQPFEWLVNQYLKIANQLPSTIESDTRGMFVNVVLITFLSALIAISTFRRLYKTDSRKRIFWFQTIVAYYLSLQLLIYGFDKVFKAQFFLPEPNILYTNVGDMHRDMLYWTVMGTSQSYSVFMGALEVLAAGLLVFPRTRIIGGFAALAIMLNVLAVNLSFDISVKAYSFFLLGCCLYVLAPYTHRLYLIFNNQNSNLVLWRPSVKGIKRTGYAMIRSLVVMLLLFESAGSYVISGNLNDDNSPRPAFHGAYRIENPNSPWKMCFVNRAGYFILQSRDNQMTDLKLGIDIEQGIFYVTDYADNTDTLEMTHANGELTHLSGFIANQPVEFQLQYLSPNNLTLFRNEFRWCID